MIDDFFEDYFEAMAKAFDENLGKCIMKLDRNGYNKIVCPLCEGDLRESRQVAYPNGEVYYEFDCNECSFSGRIRKGNLYE